VSIIFDIIVEKPLFTRPISNFFTYKLKKILSINDRIFRDKRA